MQNTSGMTHPVQCSTSLKETESRMGGSRSAAASWDAGQPTRIGRLVVAMTVKWSNRGVKCRGNGIPQQVCVCSLAVNNFLFFTLGFFFFHLPPEPF